VADTNSIVKNLELQRQWYGEPLGDRVRRLVVAYRVSQACLAEVIGVSAPMLSQVMSGRRAKIGNPAALARLIMLEHRLAAPGVEQGRLPRRRSRPVDDGPQEDLRRRDAAQGSAATRRR
jgi:transcriptional regulator with XRE-family HTH domain